MIGGASANKFTVSGWTHSATLDGGAGTDTIISSNDTDFVLADALLTRGDGASFTLASIESAQLTGGASANKFTVSGWSKTATIDGGAGTNTIISSNDTDFVLADALLTRGDGASFTLTSIQTAQLTGGASDNKFTVSGWSHSATLDGGAGSNTIISTNDANFNLSDTSLTRSDGSSFTLTTIRNAQLTGGASANTFHVGSYTGSATLTGLAGDDTYAFAGNWGTATVVEAVAQGNDKLDLSAVTVSLTVTIGANLNVTNGTSTVTSAGQTVEKVTGGTAADTFNVTPSATTAFTVDGAAGAGDVLNFHTTGLAVTQTATSLTATGMQPVNYQGFETVNQITP